MLNADAPTALAAGLYNLIWCKSLAQMRSKQGHRPPWVTPLCIEEPCYEDGLEGGGSQLMKDGV